MKLPNVENENPFSADQESSSEPASATPLIDGDFEEEKTSGEPEAAKNDPTAESTPDKDPNEKRKSLVGLSPAQDAKVGTLKQMF